MLKIPDADQFVSHSEIPAKAERRLKLRITLMLEAVTTDLISPSA
jgi:hypothetical protein